jgi:hypothetical protein
VPHAGHDDEYQQRTPDVLRGEPQVAVAEPEAAEHDDRDQQERGEAADGVERAHPPGERVRQRGR